MFLPASEIQGLIFDRKTRGWRGKSVRELQHLYGELTLYITLDNIRSQVRDEIEREIDRRMSAGEINRADPAFQNLFDQRAMGWRFLDRLALKRRISEMRKLYAQIGADDQQRLDVITEMEQEDYRATEYRKQYLSEVRRAARLGVQMTVDEVEARRAGHLIPTRKEMHDGPEVIDVQAELAQINKEEPQKTLEELKLEARRAAGLIRDDNITD